MRSLSFHRFVLPLAAAVGAATPAHGQALRSWSTLGGGSFNSAVNWSPSIVPGPQDTARFNLAGGYTVSFPVNATNAAAQVNSGSVLFDLGSSGTPRTYTVGTLTVGGSIDAFLSLRNGTVSAQTVRLQDGGHVNVGPASGFNNPAGTLSIGGLLRIDSGARLEIRSGAAAGTSHTLNANGDVLIDGGSLRRLGRFNLANGRTITVRNGGVFDHGGTFALPQNSTLHGAGGASINFGQLDVGAAVGNGTVLLEGAGTRLSANFPSFASNDSHIWGAANRSATINVRSGAFASFRGALLLASDGSAASATLNVDGPGTHFEQTNVGAGGAPDQIVIGHTSAGSAVVNVSNGALFTAESGSSGNSRVIINNTGRLNIESGATFSAAAIQRSGGQINLAGGALRFNSFTGNLTNAGGTLVPGDLGGNSNAAGIEGNYTQQSAASLEMGIGGILPGQTSLLGVAGNAILGGTLDLVLTDDFVPVLGNSFRILGTQFGNVSGTFDRINGVQPRPGVGLAVTYAPKEVVVQAALPGDANLDNVVNLTDFNRLAANFGQTGKTWLQGDFNGDGIVNLADFNRLAANFGLGASGPEVTPDDWSALAAAVPEPGSVGVLIVSSAALLRRRRRR